MLIIPVNQWAGKLFCTATLITVVIYRDFAVKVYLNVYNYICVTLYDTVSSEWTEADYLDQEFQGLGAACHHCVLTAVCSSFSPQLLNQLTLFCGLALSPTSLQSWWSPRLHINAQLWEFHRFV